MKQLVLYYSLCSRNHHNALYDDHKMADTGKHGLSEGIILGEYGFIIEGLRM